MHEYGLCEGILAAVLNRAGDRTVSRVRIRAGAKQDVDQESMAQAFQVVALGTSAAGATVELVTVPAHLACHACGHSGPTCDPLAVCPQCRGEDVTVTGGDDLIIESIGYHGMAG
jgi:hydrogenase nickel incorporation protein HypA/HybF